MHRLAQICIAIALSGLLAACGLVEGDGRHLQPLSKGTESRLQSMGSSPGEAMIIRIFKEESALEVWKRTADGSYKFFKTYEICSFSGDLGPKIREGDRQSPEGFYTISPGLMNPRSDYYLAVNTGFPNKFDRVHGRTGSNLMIHGDCSSRGCYAMTDVQIAEIYSLAREAFKGGQRDFQLQIYPFRMTTENLARHYDNPHIPFWQNLKEGYDYFEIAKRPPSWDVCERRYVFNAQSNGPLDPAGVCPTNTTEPEIMAKVKAKQSSDLALFETRVAEFRDKAAKKAADEAAAKKAAEERAQRTAEMNASVQQSTQAISGAVGGFFSGLFGGNKPAAAEPAP